MQAYMVSEAMALFANSCTLLPVLRFTPNRQVSPVRPSFHNIGDSRHTSDSAGQFYRGVGTFLYPFGKGTGIPALWGLSGKISNSFRKQPLRYYVMGGIIFPALLIPTPPVRFGSITPFRAGL